MGSLPCLRAVSSASTSTTAQIAPCRRPLALCPARRGTVVFAVRDASSENKNPQPGVLSSITDALRRVKKPVQTASGRTPVGGPDLAAFLVGGFVAMVGVMIWASGARPFRSTRGYKIKMDFPTACGIGPGTPVRIRGVRVGTAISVRPSLESVEVLAEVDDEATVIPRRSTVLASQSGLIAESLIDVTPHLPLDAYSALPTEGACEAEGVLVCEGGHIQGEPGVALDDLLYLMTKLGKQMDMEGYSKAMGTAEAAQAAIRAARPLIQHAATLTNEMLPLVRELKDGQLVKNVESLSATTAQAAKDIHRLSQDVMTKENVDALRESVMTMTKMLKHMEVISGELGKVTGDRAVQAYVRQLVESLSRLVSE